MSCGTADPRAPRRPSRGRHDSLSTATPRWRRHRRRWRRHLVSRLAHVLAMLSLAAVAGAGEIVFTEIEANGAELSVGLGFEGAFPAGSTVEVRYLAAGGAVLDSQLATPPTAGGTLQLVLDGHFPGVAARGWQHRVEVVDSAGLVGPAADLRLGLLCDAAGGACQVTTRPGLSNRGAVRVAGELAPLLAGGQTVDLAQLATVEPAWLDSLVEASIDLLTEVPGTSASPSGCACFYTYDLPLYGGHSQSFVETFVAPASPDSAVRSGQRGGGLGPGQSVGKRYWRNLVVSDAERFVADQQSSSRLDVDFHCFAVASLTNASVSITGGVIHADLPTLVPCATPKGCSPQVDWQLPSYDYGVELTSRGGSEADAILGISWRIDDGPTLGLGTMFSASAGLDFIQADQVAVPSTSVVRPTPSSSLLTLSTEVVVRDWTASHLPSAAIWLGSVHRAVGLASCAPETSISNVAVRLDDTIKAVLPVVIGPP